MKRFNPEGAFVSYIAFSLDGCNNHIKFFLYDLETLCRQGEAPLVFEKILRFSHYLLHEQGTISGRMKRERNEFLSLFTGYVKPEWRKSAKNKGFDCVWRPNGLLYGTGWIIWYCVTRHVQMRPETEFHGKKNEKNGQCRGSAPKAF